MRRQNTTKKVKWLLLGALLLGHAAWAGQGAPVQEPNGKRYVDLVIALDTSGSMDGLIDSARQKLWDVVNLLGQAKPQPILRVGLISYGGSSGYAADKGWVRKEIDLTTDLDAVYAKLFALRTSGGIEYVARAVRDATRTMQWNQDPQTLKIVFVAGNEPANQDPVVPVESAVHEARERGIFVNAIYCGSDRAAEASGWRHVAGLGQGRYAAIDHNRVVAIATPMDKELERLSGELNRTYIAYGRAGGARKAKQAEQDRNAKSLGGVAASSRAVAKASPLYSAGDWDLVDARKSGKKKLAELKDEELPPAMQAMKPAEREAYVEAKAKEREALQQKIRELSAQRERYIQAERAKQPKPASASFDDAVSGAIKVQAESSGFAF